MFLHWKQWPYWVKGGIIGLSLFLSILALVFFVLVPNYFDSCITSLNPELNNQGAGCVQFDSVLGTIWILTFNFVTPIIFIVGGIILGHLYGKNKNRRKMKPEFSPARE
jgi:hypothetical protein